MPLPKTVPWAEAAPEVVSPALYLAAYFFGGFFTVREAIDSLKLRRFEIDIIALGPQPSARLRHHRFEALHLTVELVCTRPFGERAADARGKRAGIQAHLVAHPDDRNG